MTKAQQVTKVATGIFELNTSNYYKAESIPIGKACIGDCPARATWSAATFCNPGDVAISGSYTIRNSIAPPQVSVLEFKSIGEPLPTGWNTTINAAPGTGTFVGTQVLCYNNP